MSSTTVEDPTPVEDTTPLVDHGFIEIMIHKLSTNDFRPIDIDQIGLTLQYCEQRMEIITGLIVKQYPSSSAENLLALLTAIRDVFDAIGETGNMLESSLNGIVGCVDLAVLDIQIALQVLVEAFISNCDVLASETEKRSEEPVAAAVYCLSSAIKTLLTSMSDLVEKIFSSTEVVDANVVTGLQMIVQTSLNIVDSVLYCLKRVKIMDLDGVEPSLEKFSLIIQRLASQRMNFVSKISPKIIGSISEVTDSLKSIINQLPAMARKNIESLAAALANAGGDTVHEKNISATITSLLGTLQPMMVELSYAIHSIRGITDAVAYSIDISLENLMATIKCLTYYVTIVTQMLPMIGTKDIEGNLQSVLCFIASSIQTLVDGVTLAVERALVDLVCMSHALDKARLEQQLLELQGSLEPIILMMENVIGTSMELVQNILSLAASSMSDISPDLITDMNMLTNDLRRIVKEMMESALISKKTLVEDNQIDKKSEAFTRVDDNVLSVCTTSFEEVARNSIRIRVYFNKSIEQIRKFLKQM